MSETEGKKKRSKISILRGLTALVVLVIVAIGLSWHTGTGTISSLGYNFINAICPLGALESIFGSWTLVARAVIALIAITLIVVFIGKAFCSWICPVPHIQNPFKSKKRKARELQERKEAAHISLKNWQEDKKPARGKVNADTRHLVLGGTLLTTAIFGFPVFCLVCPIGLSFATFILLWRFVQFNEPTWGLLIFPAIVIVEVIVLRKWCMKICPLGALLSLISTFNKTFRPSVDEKACIRTTKDASCEVCAEACPELIDPHSNKGVRPMTECVKCHRCADACPVHAIQFPFRKKKDEKEYLPDQSLPKQN